MPKRSRNPTDPNKLAAQIVSEATGEPQPSDGEPEVVDARDPAAVSLGRRGGLKGGPARAAKLSAAKRKAIARKAAKARWSAKMK